MRVYIITGLMGFVVGVGVVVGVGTYFREPGPTKEDVIELLEEIYGNEVNTPSTKENSNE